MKFSVSLLIAACVILSSAAASADVTLIAKNDASSTEEIDQDHHRYEKEISALDAESSSILSTLGRDRTPANGTDAGSKDGYTVTLMKVKRK